MSLKPVLIVSALGIFGAANAVSLAVYNFNDAGASGTNSASNTAALFAVDRLGANVASSFITSTFTATEITNFAGSTVGADSGDAASQALALQGGAAVGNSFVNNGANIQFSLNAATGYALGLGSLTYASQRTGTGFTSQAFSYSVNGGASYTPLTTVSGLPSAFGLQTVDLSSIPTSSSVLLRIVFDGDTSNAGNNRLDNVVFSGNAIPTQATPEPGALAALGVGAMALLRRRRASK